MRPSTEQDLCRIAASIRLTGELLELHGSRALSSLGSQQPGPSSPNLQPGRGGGSHSDPTEASAEQAVDDPRPPLATANDLLDAITIAETANLRLRRLLQSAAPAAGLQPPEADTPAQVSAAGWCVSCWRDNHYLEPVAMNPDGTRRHRDHCLWCARFIADRRATVEAHLEELKANVATLKGKAKKQARADLDKARAELKDDLLPPLELVQARHEGRRITQRMVDEALNRRQAHAA